MKSNRVGIVNYGLGNIQSLSNAMQFIGVDNFIVTDPEHFSDCSHLILPGVGSYKAAMNSLDERKLKSPLLDAVNCNTPVLGICLGMQLLFDQSVEGGVTKGLGIICGEASALDVTPEFKVPQTQWNKLEYHGHDQTLNSALNNKFFYFSHSYAVYNSVLTQLDEYALTHYGGSSFLSYAKSGNLQTMQFHPENSGKNGLSLLRSFIGD